MRGCVSFQQPPRCVAAFISPCTERSLNKLLSPVRRLQKHLAVRSMEVCPWSSLRRSHENAGTDEDVCSGAIRSHMSTHTCVCIFLIPQASGFYNVGKTSDMCMINLKALSEGACVIMVGEANTCTGLAQTDYVLFLSEGENWTDGWY